MFRRRPRRFEARVLNSDFKVIVPCGVYDNQQDRFSDDGRNRYAMSWGQAKRLARQMNRESGSPGN